VETPRKFITAKLSIRKPGSSSVLIIYYTNNICDNILSHIISTDEDPGLRIESFAVINLRGVSTSKTIICFIAMQTYKEVFYYMALHVCKNGKKGHARAKYKDKVRNICKKTIVKNVLLVSKTTLQHFLYRIL
jgi:hypothetical protein